MNTESIVIWPEKPEWACAELVSSLRQTLGGRVREAWLIGSYAAGTADGDSDIDLILVTDTTLSWPDRGTEFADLRDLYGAVDLLIYRSEEWQILLVHPTVFIANVCQSWVKLI